jgi:hypothetical protein
VLQRPLDAKPTKRLTFRPALTKAGAVPSALKAVEGELAILLLQTRTSDSFAIGIKGEALVVIDGREVSYFAGGWF